MIKKNLYTFPSTSSLGIFGIPIKSPILIEDFDGNGTPKQILLLAKTGLSSGSTIANLIANTALWASIDSETLDGLDSTQFLRSDQADSMVGTLTSQHIIPALSDTYDLGSHALPFRDLYLGPQSLYVNGQQVISDNAGTINVHADINQNIRVETAGIGGVEIAAVGNGGVTIDAASTGNISITTDTGNIELKGTITVLTGKTVNTSDGSVLVFNQGSSFSGDVSATSFTENGVALSTKYALSSKVGLLVGAGIATLTDGKVPTSQLPAYVDDVITGANLTVIESITPLEAGKIYIALDTNITYRWSGTGTTMVEISSSLALGTTSATAYAGDLGKIAYDHSQAVHAPTNADNTALNETSHFNVVVDASYVHTDNNFTTALKNSYDTAVTWGDHSIAGYLVNQYVLPASVVHDTEKGALHATDALRIVGSVVSLYKGDGTFDSITIPNSDTVYTHPSYATTNIDTTGATIIDLITTTAEGHISAMSTRVLTLANLGYTGSTTANDYTLPIATALAIGGVQGGADITVDVAGEMTIVANSHNHTSANISDATNVNTANMVVKRDASGDFNAGNINAETAVNLGSTQQATIEFNAVENSIDFIIN